MKNLKLIRERYLKDDLPRRVGALAANLARIVSFSKSNRSPDTVKGLLRESIYFIEWTILEAPVELQEELVRLQIRLALWSYRLREGRQVSQEMISELDQNSENLLELSGLAA